ncbi:MAG TPA: type IV toxin-antitoxin system AbiEi family antitoxin domain-containing protein [Acidimicrobiales bacterium]|nr:type IV toxin-antitoxin system AbiEi family antitoxin domain-containing protein [Acidimicrobiales bacterium]
MPVPPAVFSLAERQHGSVAVPQLIDLGVTPWMIRRMVDSGRWVRVTTMVLRMAGAPSSRGQRVMEAVLDAGVGAVLSHRACAAWWRIRGFHLHDIEVSRLRGTNSIPARLAYLVHEPRSLPAHHLTVLDGVPVTIPSRIPFDLAGTHPWLAEKALDRAWAANLLTYKSSMAMLDDLAERGRRGITLMRELLAARGPDYRPNDTNLEDRFQELAREAGLYELVRQRELLGREWIGRVDFVDERHRLVIEVDSALYHEALIDQAADEARTKALEAAGYRVERFTDSEIWFRPQATLTRLRRIGARFSPASGT